MYYSQCSALLSILREKSVRSQLLKAFSSSTVSPGWTVPGVPGAFLWVSPGRLPLWLWERAAFEPSLTPSEPRQSGALIKVPVGANGKWTSQRKNQQNKWGFIKTTFGRALPLIEWKQLVFMMSSWHGRTESGKMSLSSMNEKPKKFKMNFVNSKLISWIQNETLCN